MDETNVSYYEDAYYNYTYDYEESVAHLPLDEFVPVAVVYAWIGLTGTIGNILVIFAISKVQRMSSITNMFVRSLACADLLLLLICVPAKCIAFYSYTWRLGLFMCKFVVYVQNVSMICSVLTLTAMSIERCIAIQYPLKAKSLCTIFHARVVVFIVWCISLVAAVPIIFAQEYKEIAGVHRTAIWCHKIWTGREDFAIAYELYMLILLFVIPVSVMLVTYASISVTIWRVATKRADMRSGSCISNEIRMDRPSVVSMESQPKTTLPITVSPASISTYSPQKTKAHAEDDKTRKQVVLTLIVIVVLFALCWLPVLINNVLVAFGVLDYLSHGYMRHVRLAFHILSYANSSINPFVYAFMSKKFREGFRQAICACVRGNAYIRKQMSARSVTSTTRASTSNSSGKDANGHMQEIMNRKDSMSPRRPSDMVELEMRKL
ncbi:hypothetical protein ACJMK2_015532 [Sinanodonta woodiana]|uniref:G-protein coupled receptors family 1 profile domain-containing protein n=1 Tax=Sinanodonta woodiana TaxID=1069815 RepID=A0ABD3UUB7_SINWO